MTDGAVPHPARRVSRGWTAAVVLLAAGTRCFRLLAHGFWYDEALDYLETRHIVEILGSLDFREPPLFSVLYRPSVALLPPEAAMKVPSALLGVLSCWLLIRLGLELLGDPRAALCAGGIAAGSPISIFFSQQGAHHALALAATALSLLVFVRLLRRGVDATWRVWFLYFTAHFLLLYTHHFGNLLLLAEWVAAGLLRHRLRGILKPWLLVQLLLLLLQLPLLSALLTDLGGVILSRDFWIVPITWQTPLESFRFFTVGFYAVGWQAWLGMAAALAAMVAGFRWVRSRDLALPVLLPVLLLPPAVLAVASWTIRPVYIERSLLVVTLPLQLLAGAGLARLRSSWLLTTAAVLWGLLLAQPLWHQYENRLFPHPARGSCSRLEAKRAVWDLATLRRPGDAIVHTTLFGLLPFRVHGPPGMEQSLGIASPDDRRLIGYYGYFPTDRAGLLRRWYGIEFQLVRDLLPRADRIWLVCTDPAVASPDGWFTLRLIRELRGTHRCVDRRQYDGLHLRLFQRWEVRPDPPGGEAS